MRYKQKTNTKRHPLFTFNFSPRAIHYNNKPKPWLESVKPCHILVRVRSEQYVSCSSYVPQTTQTGYLRFLDRQYDLVRLAQAARGTC